MVVGPSPSPLPQGEGRFFGRMAGADPQVRSLAPIAADTDSIRVQTPRTLDILSDQADGKKRRIKKLQTPRTDAEAYRSINKIVHLVER
jgi:hypothetical protein